jgi:hypothetical protein
MMVIGSVSSCADPVPRLDADVYEGARRPLCVMMAGLESRALLSVIRVFVIGFPLARFTLMAARRRLFIYTIRDNGFDGNGGS